MSFDALAAFDPLARLVRRSPTLDGAVPLRVAQACVPMLEGNALGHQVVFRLRLVARVRLGRPCLAATPERAAIDRVHHAAIPWLVAQGLLVRGGAWHRRLEEGWFWVEQGALRVFTGLLVRPRRGRWLRVGPAKNRAILGVGVREAWIGDGDAYVPLVLDFERLFDGARLEGEVATLIAAVPGAAVGVASAHEGGDLARAHAAFYDAAYFQRKKTEITRKYRRLVVGRGAPGEGEREGSSELAPASALPAPPPSSRVVHLAGPRPEVEHVHRTLGDAATSPVPDREGRSVGLVRFVNAVGFAAQFDGNTVAIEPDADALARGAREVEGALAGVLGAPWLTEHRGAVLYLTKYFTPHPHGEPHFFVKPWSFSATPPGWSSVVEGASGDGFDILRGVVWTDRFHATPAVFQLQPGRELRVACGAPLATVFAVPRSVMAEDAEVRSAP